MCMDEINIPREEHVECNSNHMKAGHFYVLGAISNVITFREILLSQLPSPSLSNYDAAVETTDPFLKNSVYTLD